MEEKYQRVCPKCGRELVYSCRNSLNRALRNNDVCLSCALKGKKKKPFSKEHRKNIGIGIKNSEKYKKSNKIRGKNISKSKKGIKFTEEHKKQLEIGKQNSEKYKNMRTNEYRKKLSIAGKKKIFTLEHRKNLRLAAIRNIEKRAGQISPNYNPNSISIIEQKADELGITDLQHAENGGEFHIKELGYWVDGYSSEKNIVIEVDEEYHFDVNGKLKQKDIQRQVEIIKELNCKFIRVNIETKEIMEVN